MDAELKQRLCGSSRRRIVLGTAVPSASEETTAPFPAEIALVWALLGVVAVEILITYTRLPARELYHVSGSGLTGGGSRALVFFNFPVALMAIPIAVLVGERLRSRPAWIATSIAVALSAAIFWPGVVKQSDLDARAVNAIAAVGVVLSLAITITAAWKLGRPRWAERQFGDRLRVVLAVVVLVLAAPWAAADLGFFLDGVPVLGNVFQTGEYLDRIPGLRPFPPAVHHGHHHGMDGVLLVLAALLLSRVVPAIGQAWVRRAVGAYLALMFCYGVGNIANDAWLEQVVKRGWTTWDIPNVLEPRLTVAWIVIVLGTVALLALALGIPREPAGPTSPTPEGA
jgi:hypothetical protein